MVKDSFFYGENVCLEGGGENETRRLDYRFLFDYDACATCFFGVNFMIQKLRKSVYLSDINISPSQRKLFS